MLIIDRFEGDYAVIEFINEFFNIPKSALPIKAKEGDVLNIVIDSNSTASRKKRIEGLMNDVFKS